LATSGDMKLTVDTQPAGRAVRGWFEFVKDERRLLVKNINFTSAESVTGADLVYVSRGPDSIVLVQYKLLDVMKSTGELVFRDDGGRLLRQADAMLKLCGDQIDRSSDENEARVGSDFGFVKFVSPTPAASIRSDRLPEGRYMPVDAVRRMLTNPDRGPRGADVHYVHRRRYLDGETFARLVRDRWVGSRIEATNVLLMLLGLAPTRTPTTIAVDEPLTRASNS
jgi:hypothetical protein